MKGAAVMTRFIAYGILMSAFFLLRAGAVTIGVSGDRFTLNGTPGFLLGVSYFDAKNWHASDLDEIHHLGFNSIRIWIDWADQGFFDPNGDWRAKQTLLDLIAAANRRDLAVDVTVLNSDPHTRNSFGVPQRGKVVRSVFSALKDSKNVIYDIMNEHDHEGTPASHSDLKELIRIARSSNSNALITVSSTEPHLIDADEMLQTRNVAEEIDAGIAMLTPHLRRSSNWYLVTAMRVKMLKDYLVQTGHVMPIYLNEEARRGYRGFYPPAEHLLQAAQSAQAAGAAGYNFHTGACFDLRTRTLFDQLDSEERKAVAAMPALIFGPTKQPSAGP